MFIVQSYPLFKIILVALLNIQSRWFQDSMATEVDESKIQADLAAKRKMEREKQDLLERARILREEQLRQAEIEREERAKRMEKEMELKKDEERRRREEEHHKWLLEQERMREEEAMAQKIALEERRLIIAQRKLESIRLLTFLFEQIKMSKMGDEKERRMLEELLEARKRVEREKAEVEQRRLEAEQMEREKQEQEEALRQMLMRKLSRRETPPPPETSAASKPSPKNRPNDDYSDEDDSLRKSAAPKRGKVKQSVFIPGRPSKGVLTFTRPSGNLPHFAPKTGAILGVGSEHSKGPADPRLPSARKQQYVPQAVRKFLSTNPDRLLDINDPEVSVAFKKALAAVNARKGKLSSPHKSIPKNGRWRHDKYEKSSSRTKSKKTKTKRRSRSRSRSSSSSSSRSSRSSSSSSSYSSSSSSSRDRNRNRSKKIATKKKYSRKNSRSPSPKKMKKSAPSKSSLPPRKDIPSKRSDYSKNQKNQRIPDRSTKLKRLDSGPIKDRRERYGSSRNDRPSPPPSSKYLRRDDDLRSQVKQQSSSKRNGRGIVASTTGGPSKRTEEPRFTFFSHTAR